jgi:uncharacterized protein with von Willebrand factor type A (vWA) domain
VIGRDLVETLARFGAALRGAGIACDVAALRAYAVALAGDTDLGSFGLYWYARITLVRSIDDVPAFDRVFTEFWYAGHGAALEEPAQRRGATPAPAKQPQNAVERAATMAVERDDLAGGDDAEVDAVIAASSHEQLRERDFADFSDAEWHSALRLMSADPAPQELRASRRVAIRRHGRRLDVGATLREEQRTFGLRAAPRYCVHKRVLRPLVFLCDVSGSMAPYGRALLLYAYVVSRARRKIGVFAFGTRLTDLTEYFARREQRGFARALRAVPDWGGGTLIGNSLRTFNRRFAPRGVARGATVVLVSDGCERDDPALVGREMAQLARSARRIVWINPRKSDPAYEPLVRGMAAALPSIDAFLPGHNLRSLDAVAAAVRHAHSA